MAQVTPHPMTDEDLARMDDYCSPDTPMGQVCMKMVRHIKFLDLELRAAKANPGEFHAKNATEPGMVQPNQQEPGTFEYRTITKMEHDDRKDRRAGRAGASRREKREAEADDDNASSAASGND